jgi:hypothetical protein
VLTIERWRGLAAREGWELADLARVLICLGAAFSFLTLEDLETAKRFRTIASVSKMLPMLDAALHKPSRRSRAANGIARTELLALRLPRGLCGIITTYASTRGNARNEVLTWFLERGLIIYMKGENALLQTIRWLTQDRTEREKQEKRNECHGGPTT